MPNGVRILLASSAGLLLTATALGEFVIKDSSALFRNDPFLLLFVLFVSFTGAWICWFLCSSPVHIRYRFALAVGIPLAALFIYNAGLYGVFIVRYHWFQLNSGLGEPMPIALSLLIFLNGSIALILTGGCVFSWQRARLDRTWFSRT